MAKARLDTSNEVVQAIVDAAQVSGATTNGLVQAGLLASRTGRAGYCWASANSHPKVGQGDTLLGSGGGDVLQYAASLRIAVAVAD